MAMSASSSLGPWLSGPHEMNPTDFGTHIQAIALCQDIVTFSQPSLYIVYIVSANYQVYACSHQ